MRRRVTTLSAMILAAAAIAASYSFWPETAAAQGGNEKTIHISFPIVEPRNTCEGEVVEVSGELEGIIHTSVDAQGGAHVSGHFVVRATGTVLSSGDEYIYRESLQSISNLVSCPTVFTETVHSTLIRQGPDGEDSRGLVAHAMMHITLNASCEPTAFVSDLRIECPGFDSTQP